MALNEHLVGRLHAITRSDGSWAFHGVVRVDVPAGFKLIATPTEDADEIEGPTWNLYATPDARQYGEGTP